MHNIIYAASAIASLTLAELSFAQTSQAAAESPPYIAASASGETRVTPDRAMLQITVDARAESAASAAAQNRDKQERVIAAVKRMVSRQPRSARPDTRSIPSTHRRTEGGRRASLAITPPTRSRLRSVASTTSAR